MRNDDRKSTKLVKATCVPPITAVARQEAPVVYSGNSAVSKIAKPDLEDDPSNNYLDLARLAIKSMTILGAFAYVAGFLIDYTFSNSFFIRDSSVEIFKAKYIYTGLLFLQFPLSILAVAYTFRKIEKKYEEFNAKWPDDVNRHKKIYESAIYTFLGSSPF